MERKLEPVVLSELDFIDVNKKHLAVIETKKGNARTIALFGYYQTEDNELYHETMRDIRLFVASESFYDALIVLREAMLAMNSEVVEKLQQPGVGLEPATRELIIKANDAFSKAIRKTKIGDL